MEHCGAHQCRRGTAPATVSVTWTLRAQTTVLAVRGPNLVVAVRLRGVEDRELIGGWSVSLKVVVLEGRAQVHVACDDRVLRCGGEDVAMRTTARAARSLLTSEPSPHLSR